MAASHQYSENQKSSLKLSVSPAGGGTGDWCVACPYGTSTHNYVIYFLPPC